MFTQCLENLRGMLRSLFLVFSCVPEIKHKTRHFSGQLDMPPNFGMLKDGGLMANETKRQHFISQAELRLNALNPLANAENQRVYRFHIVDREAFEIALDSPRGVKISNTAAWTDLFTYDVVDERLRMNLEGAFHRYESSIPSLTQALLEGTAGGSSLSAVAVDLFIAKFINLLRNPYSVAKALNTIGLAAQYEPVDEQLRTKFRRIRAGAKPHIDATCQRFRLSREQYIRWIESLFMLLEVGMSPNETLLESIARQLFFGGYADVRVFTYSPTHGGETCLISDRGFCTRISNAALLRLEFNLCSRAFIQYGFADLDRFTPDRSPLIALAAQEMKLAIPDVKYRSDDIEELRSFNRLTVNQSDSVVYGSEPKPPL
jgi:hypothetical protein